MSEIKPEDSTLTENRGETNRQKPRPPKPQYAVTIAVSSRTLFNMVKERKIFEEEGVEKYVAYQVEHENEPLKPGAAFPFVKGSGIAAMTGTKHLTAAAPIGCLSIGGTEHSPLGLKVSRLARNMVKALPEALMTVNSRLRKLYPDSDELFDIVLMTNNHAQVGVRLINSINHYDLTIERFCMTGGQSPIGYLKAYMTNLYLSKDSDKVTEAIEEGIAAATMFMQEKENELSDIQLRVAFDGDAVLFSDEAEIIFQKHGVDAFNENEQQFENKPLAQGPLKCFLEALGKLQRKFYAKNERMNCPIRTFLVTARSAAGSGVRALKTLRSWGLEIDEALFLAEAPKGPLLQKIKPHIYFDDLMFNIEGAKELGTISAHVPYGIWTEVEQGETN